MYQRGNFNVIFIPNNNYALFPFYQFTGKGLNINGFSHSNALINSGVGVIQFGITENVTKNFAIWGKYFKGK